MVVSGCRPERLWTVTSGALALGYVEPPPPEGCASWEAWLAEQGVPEDEWDDGAYLVDRTGRPLGCHFCGCPSRRQPRTESMASGISVDFP